jgi:hypothetical protein
MAFPKGLSFKKNSQFYREPYQLNFVIDSNFEILLAFLTLTFFLFLVSKHIILQPLSFLLLFTDSLETSIVPIFSNRTFGTLVFLQVIYLFRLCLLSYNVIHEPNIS